MALTFEVPNNVPVSWLTRLYELSDDTLMLASHPDDRTETLYMSKYFTYYDLYTNLSDIFDLGDILERIRTMELSQCWLSDLSDCTMSCQTATSPYIISAISQSHGNITELKGYWLSTGLSIAFSLLGTNPTTTLLSILIPSLGKKTTAMPADKCKTHYISSITDAHGHVQSYGMGQLSDALASSLPSNTVGVTPGNYVSSVTTLGGKVTSLGQHPLTGYVSRVGYKDFTKQTDTAKILTSTTFTDADRINLNIMKLTYNQLKALSSNNKIEKDCIYMTINDPE